MSLLSPLLLGFLSACTYAISFLCQPNSSSVTSWRVAICLLLASSFSLVVAHYRLSVLWTLLLLPFLALLIFLVIRAVVAFPPTMQGNILPNKYRGKRYQLVAMPVNHFGEKLRWCMDLIEAPYEECTVGGLLSIFLRGRSVPWLTDRQSCSHIGNSDEALMYLQAVHIPTIPDASLRKACQQLLARDETTMGWEKMLNKLGHAIQGYAYYYLLADKIDPIFALTAWGGTLNEPHVPFIQSLLLSKSFPIFKALLTQNFNLESKEKCQEREAIILDVLNKADAALEGKAETFLCGQHLTYVDITFCALMAPLFPRTIFFRRPHSLFAGGRFKSFAEAQTFLPHYPSQLLEFEEKLLQRPSGQLVQRLYQNKRKTIRT
eukprot:g35586.t1